MDLIENENNMLWKDIRRWTQKKTNLASGQPLFFSSFFPLAHPCLIVLWSMMEMILILSSQEGCTFKNESVWFFFLLGVVLL